MDRQARKDMTAAICMGLVLVFFLFGAASNRSFMNFSYNPFASLGGSSKESSRSLEEAVSEGRRNDDAENKTDARKDSDCYKGKTKANASSEYLRWTLDAEAELAPIGFRLQVAEDKLFSRVIYDTGDIQSKQKSYQLPSAALPHSQKYYWRVRSIYSDKSTDNWTEGDAFFHKAVCQ